jgi:hypothetical protein
MRSSAQPAQTSDPELLRKVLEDMQAAARGPRRLDQALNQADSEAMTSVLRSMNLETFDQVIIAGAISAIRSSVFFLAIAEN